MPERVHRRFSGEWSDLAENTKTGQDTDKASANPFASRLDSIGGNSELQEDRRNSNLNLPPPIGGTIQKPDRSSTHAAPRLQRQAQPNVTRNIKDRARSLLPIRQKLPIWPKAEAIRRDLRTKDVLLLVGETGSGKSTQVPQFLVTEPWCQRQTVRLATDSSVTGKKEVSVGGCVAITEPRRVAAITLARRVADEMGSPLGSVSPASVVGYSVRFDNSTSPSTRVKFLTEGMLLQEMLRDPWLRQYSAVVVDEVHERGVNVDLLMGFLRKMVAGSQEGRGGLPLKVVVMSATADMLGLLKFFGDRSEGSEGNKAESESLQSGSRMKEDDEGSEWHGFSSASDDEFEVNRRSVQETGIVGKAYTSNGQTNLKSQRFSNRKPTKSTSGGSPDTPGDENQLDSYSKHVSICQVEGRQYPVKMVYSPSPVPDIIEASLRIVFEINYKEPLPGDILVFLPGQSTVEALCALVTSHAKNLSPSLPNLLALPLFAALPQHAQQLVFRQAPPKNRKVIVATNIAETSLTVPGVRHVVDGGKSKVKQFRPQLGLDSLLVKPISQSAAIQRAGRAGREGPGSCHRLYTASDFATLAPVPEPEILRADLAQAVLALKAQGVPTREIPAFPFLSPPPREALEAALLHLHRLGALDDSGEITRDVGTRIARLPVSAALGRALLAAAEAEMDCLDEMVDLAACLSGEAIFLAVEDEEGREKAEAARRGLLRREGDHPTMLAALRAFLEEGVDRKDWAARHFVSHRAMRGVLDIRKQLRALAPSLSSAASLSPTTTTATAATAASASDAKGSNVLRCLLRGFPLNAALLSPDGSYRTLGGRQAVAIHPGSVLHGRRGAARPAAIVYSEFVYTTRAYARGVSAVEREWVLQALGA